MKFTRFIPYVIIFLLIISVYGKVTHFFYTWSDDDVLIGKQYGFIKDLRNIPAAFQQDAFLSSGNYSTFYRPLLTVSFIIDAQYCKLNGSCYHVTNLLLHIIFTLILYVFLQKIGISKSISFFLTLIFSVHPAISSAVAWISGRNDSLLGIFFLLAFIYFMDWERSKKNRYLILHTLFFTFALYTKELTLLLPVIIFSYYLLIKRKNPINNKSILVLPIWSISIIIWLTLRHYAITAPSATFYQLSPSNLPGFIVYLGNILPINLSVLPILRDSNLVPGIIIAFVLLAGLYFFRKKNRGIIFGYLWFALLTLPSVAQSDRALKFLLEHRNYLPFVGILIAFSSVISDKSKYKKLFILIAVFIVIIFSLITFKRIDYYQNPLVFNTQSTIESPHSAEAFETLGHVYQAIKNDPVTASRLYRKALELNPEVANAHTNLGIIYLEKGLYKEAEQEILQEKISDNDYTWLHLGRAYYAQGKKYKALYAWEHAYAISPYYLPVVINLALVNADLGNYKEAKKYYLQAVVLGGYEGPDKKFLEKIRYLEK